MVSKPISTGSKIFNPFSNMKVGLKVGLGSGIILLLLVVVASVSYFGLSGANTNFVQYREYALQTNQLGRIQANLLTARLNAKDYILNNSDEAADKVSERIDVTLQLIDEGVTMFTREDALEDMRVNREEIAEYQESFGKVTELVNKRNALVDTMNTLGPRAEKNLTAIMESAFKDNDASASFLAGMDLRALLLARLYSNRFLVDNLPASAERATQELDNFEAKAQEMLKELQNPTRRQLATEVLEDAGAYKTAFQDVVATINERNGIISGTLDVIGPKVAQNMEDLKLENKALQDELGPRATKEVNTAVQTASIVSLMAVLLGTLLAFLTGRSISRPVANMTDTMRKLAAGDHSVTVPALGQTDEIGQMADAVQTFKDAAIEKERMEREADENRSLTEKERAEREAAKAAEAASLNEAIESLAGGLDRLSDGDLTVSLGTPFAGDLDRLRTNFNTSVEKLAETLSDVKTNISSIHANAGEMRSAVEDLSKRTEQQAASLEETSAALEQITSTVKNSSERAQDATKKAAEAKAATEASTSVVANAVGAMSRIESASDEIAKIIGVIDEIAFQTNLLALNAGVEAARAGEAGKGFAVVAQEVRELAQRSASAAKEIKTLISKSGVEVESGVELVKATGEALSNIAAQVVEINTHIDSIATAAREQATGLQEVNIAVSQMDQVTQQNAAMVEETTAVTHRLANEADGLSNLVSRFKTSGTAGVARPNQAFLKEVSGQNGGNAVASRSPAKTMMNKVKQAFGGGAATAEDQWSEF